MKRGSVIPPRESLNQNIRKLVKNIPKCYEIELNQKRDRLNILSFAPCEHPDDKNQILINNNNQENHSNQNINLSSLNDSKNSQHNIQNSNNIYTPSKGNQKRKSVFSHRTFEFRGNHRGSQQQQNHPDSRKVTIIQQDGGKSKEKLREELDKAFKTRQEVIQEYVNGDIEIDQLFFCRNFPHLHQKQKEKENDDDSNQSLYKTFLMNEEQKQYQKRMSRMQKGNRDFIRMAGKKLTATILNQQNQNSLEHSQQPSKNHQQRQSILYQISHQISQQDSSHFHPQNVKFNESNPNNNNMNLTESREQGKFKRHDFGKSRTLIRKNREKSGSMHKKEFQTLQESSINRLSQSKSPYKQQQEIVSNSNTLTQKSKSSYNIANVRQLRAVSPLRQFSKQNTIQMIQKQQSLPYQPGKINSQKVLQQQNQQGSQQSLSFLTNNSQPKLKKKKPQQLSQKEAHLGYYTPYIQKNKKNKFLEDNLTDVHKDRTDYQIYNNNSGQKNVLGSLNNFSLDMNSTTNQDLQNLGSMTQLKIQEESENNTMEIQNQKKGLINDMLRSKFVKNYVNPNESQGKFSVSDLSSYDNYFTQGNYTSQNTGNQTQTNLGQTSNSKLFTTQDRLSLTTKNSSSKNKNFVFVGNTNFSTTNTDNIYTSPSKVVPSLGSYRQDLPKMLKIPKLKVPKKSKKKKTTKGNINISNTNNNNQEVQQQKSQRAKTFYNADREESTERFKSSIEQITARYNSNSNIQNI